MGSLGDPYGPSLKVRRVVSGVLVHAAALATKKNKSKVATSSTRKEKRGFSSGFDINPRGFQLRSAKPTEVSKLGAPERLLVPLRYMFDFNLNTASTSYDEKVFRLNSLFDFDYTNTGHQPLYYDFWSIAYSRYRVLSVDFEIQACLETGTEAYVFGMVPTHNAGVSSSYYDQFEEAGAKSLVIGPSGPPRKLKVRYSMAELFGLTDSEYSDISYQSDVGSNPADVWYGHLRCQTVNQSTGGTCVGRGIATLWAEFSIRNDMTVSLLKEFSLFKQAVKEKEPNKPSLDLKVLSKNFDVQK